MSALRVSIVQVQNLPVSGERTSENFLPCLVVRLSLHCDFPQAFGITCVLPCYSFWHCLCLAIFKYSLALILSDPALVVFVSPPPCHLVVIVLFSLHVLLKLPYFFMSISSRIVSEHFFDLPNSCAFNLNWSNGWDSYFTTLRKESTGYSRHRTKMVVTKSADISLQCIVDYI